jgi:DNA-binding NarL/FixJ family response regulator
VELIRIVLAEDHVLVRSGIRALLESLEGIRVVAEASSGHEALEQIGKTKPHLVLTDIGMPGLNGLGLAERTTKEFPDVHVIILSMHANEEYVLQALRAGAKGYVLKDAETSELEMAIRAVVSGKTFLSPLISGKVIEDYLDRLSGKKGSARDGNCYAILTARQREILQLIAEGNTNKDVARKLTLSVKTVESHRTQIMERLNIHDTASLVRYAIRSGIIQPS